MSTPIIIVSGPAGSGKDTAAHLIAKSHNGVCIALADPIKRLAADLFGFDEQQLWGESSFRNAPDDRYRTRDGWHEADCNIRTVGYSWLKTVAPHADYQGLLQWYRNLKSAHVDINDEVERVLTPRYALQTLGTEWGRRVSSDLWIDLGIRTATMLLAGGPRYSRTQGLSEDVSYHPPDFVVITDGRFRNELLKVQMIGGTTIRIQPVEASKDALATSAAGIAGHRSESELGGIPEHFYTYILVNDKQKGLGELERLLGGLMDQVKRGATTKLASWVAA